MRLLWIIVAIVALIAVATLAPAVSYSQASKGDKSLEVEVSAFKPSLTDPYGQYTINATTGEKIGYLSYIGKWWGSLIKPAQAEIDYPRVGVAIVIVHPESDGQFRESHEYGYDYNYGDSFKASYKFNVFSGSTIEITVRIYDGYGIYTELNKHYVVE